MRYKITKTPEFKEWLADQEDKSQVQIYERLAKIQDQGHFGTKKTFDSGVSELKWVSGRRVYYTIIPVRNVIVLIGGNKNGQSKDITQAEKILRRIKND